MLYAYSSTVLSCQGSVEQPWVEKLTLGSRKPASGVVTSCQRQGIDETRNKYTLWTLVTGLSHVSVMRDSLSRQQTSKHKIRRTI